MELQQPFYIEKRTLPGSHLDLNGEWSFCLADQPTEEPARLSFPYGTTLPSSAYFDLYKAGVLPHPYEGLNSMEYRFADQKVWYYRRKFSLAEYESRGKAFLCFDGVGYFTRVWLNGALLGEHEGLFGGPIVEVNENLRFDGENDLIVEVKSCNYGIPDEEWKNIYRNPEKKYLVPWNMVKDSHTSNGCFTVMGIYRDVRLELVPGLHLSRPYLTTESLEGNSARLHLSVEIAPEDVDELRVPTHDRKGNGYVYGYVRGMNVIETDVTVEVTLSLTEKSTGRTAFCATYTQTLFDGDKVGINPKYKECQFLERDLELKDPRLWYPQGLGDPELYTAELTLFWDGKRLDAHTFDFGVRTFRLERTAGRRMRTRWGRFQFVVNGKKFFAKGMNWTPLDAVLNITEQDYRWALELAREERVQVIRVWGAGNAPEHDLFYRLCDEYGILVWQDSFISNHSNPQWDKMLFTAQQNMYLYRLRNHPSLAIHCSGNENNPYADENHCVWVWQHATEDLDPSRERVRTTPDGGGAHIYRGFEPCWFRKIYKELPFIGEAGTHTFPNAKSLRRLISPEEFGKPIAHFGTEEMFGTHPELTNHITENDSWGMLKKIPAMSHICRMGDNTVSELCEATGISSYEYYQFMAQAMREQYPVTGGILPWVFKRPWTTVAVQMVDGLGDPVAPYYAVKNAYAPLEVHLALPELVYAAGETVEWDVRVINESYADHRVTVKTEVFDPRMRCVYTRSQDAAICADAYQTRLSADPFVIPKAFDDRFFFLRVSLFEEEKQISQSVYWPVVMSCMREESFRKERREECQDAMMHEDGPWLKNQLEEISCRAELSAEISDARREGDRVYGRITLRNPSDCVAFPVHICFDNDGFCQCLDDDWFFLEAGAERTLSFVLRNDACSAEDIRCVVSAWNADALEIIF